MLVSFIPNNEIIHKNVVSIAEIYTKSITGFSACVLGLNFIKESFIALFIIFLSKLFFVFLVIITSNLPFI